MLKECRSHTSCPQMGVCWSQDEGEVSRTVLLPQQNRDQPRHTSFVFHLGQAHSLNFVPPVPSLLCAGLVATDHPRELGTHSRWAVVAATGRVPLTIMVLTVCSGGAGGLYPVGGVVLLVGLCPCYQWTRCSWWALPALPMPRVLSQRCTTPAFGQGSCAVFLVCLIPRPQWVGL